jgi:hypothetical protein
MEEKTKDELIDNILRKIKKPNRHEMILGVLKLIIYSCFYFVVIPVLLVAIIKTPFIFEIKMIFVLGFICFLIFFLLVRDQLDSLRTQITNIQRFTRINYISNETKRLSPDSQTPAETILEQDLMDEEYDENYLAYISVITYGVPILLVLECGFIFLLIRYWPLIKSIIYG